MSVPMGQLQPLEAYYTSAAIVSLIWITVISPSVLLHIIMIMKKVGVQYTSVQVMTLPLPTVISLTTMFPTPMGQEVKEVQYILQLLRSILTSKAVSSVDQLHLQWVVPYIFQMPTWQITII